MRISSVEHFQELHSYPKSRVAVATDSCRAVLGLDTSSSLRAGSRGRPSPHGHGLELYRDRFAIGGRSFEELLLLEAEHPGQNVGRERLNLGVQVAHNGVVVAAGVLNSVLDFTERIL